MNLIEKNSLASDVITHDVSPLTVNTDSGAYSKLGWLIVLLGVGGFLLWAFLAPLDKGVPLTGTIAKESNRKTIQNQAGGTVEEILVKEGETVKAGQVLVRMNGVQVKSQEQISQVQFFASRAAEARLQAERDGKKTIPLPAALQPYKDDPRVLENMAVQSQLMAARQAALQSELGAADQNVAGLRLQMESVKSSRESKREQLAILKEQLDNVRELAKDGYVARSKQLDLERNYIQIVGAIAEDTGAIGRAGSQVAEIAMKRAQRLQEYQRDIRTQLSDVRKEADALGSRIVADQYAVSNIEVKSPVDGVVVGLAVFTRGGVVAPGFRMMEVVPTNDALIVEGTLPTNLVDKVHPGLKTELIFVAFNANATPHIPGVVTSVSADRLVDDKGAPYYKVQARVTPEGLKMMAAKKMDVRPGMPVELFVKTGERSLVNYLMKPVLDRAKTSMSEE